MAQDNLEIGAAELKALLATQSIHLVDVREDFEVRAGHIPRAQHIPLGQLTARLDEIPTHLPIVVYCAHGVRSYQAANFMRSQGLTGVLSLAGGIARWTSVGGAVVRP